jgi:DNA-binding CsgD family transcriptional regulator
VCGRTFARGRQARYCSPACKQRAVRLRRNEPGVPIHASAVLAKLGAHSRLEAVVIATRLGILG